MQEELIEKAKPTSQRKTPMEFLFDTFEQFIDLSGHYDDFNCPVCRNHVLDQYKKMLPYLKKLEENAKANISS